MGRAEPEKNSRRAPFTATALARQNRLFPSTARLFPKVCWKVNCSGTNAAHSPGRSHRKRAVWKWPMAASFSSMKLANSLPLCKSNCCACCKSASSSGWAVRVRSQSMCGSSRPATEIWKKPFTPGHFAATYFSGSTSSHWLCLRCASAARIFPCSRSISFPSLAQSAS